ncbi:hypothetical protein, partial [Streptomyces sp. CNZ748]|uniref:hypothetical protein n=1 Tax=Streptomyces sp. CNZ748 TaxID=2885160 RepID=UPI001E2A95DB
MSSTNATVTFSYDGNVKSRTDASGTTKWDYDKLNRESALQNGAQTALAYTPGGDVDHYTDPTGTTERGGGLSGAGRRLRVYRVWAVVSVWSLSMRFSLMSTEARTEGTVMLGSR